MFEEALRMNWPQDLPVCFPGRMCVDESPFGADLINAVSALTPVSSAIAAGCFTVLGASLVLVGLGLRLQWRGSRLRPWLVVLAAALLLIRFAIAEAVGSRFDAISAIYSDLYGQRSARAPGSLTGSWPSVLFAADAMMLLGVASLAALTVGARLQRRRQVRG